MAQMCWPGLPQIIKRYPGLAVSLVTGIPAPDLVHTTGWTLVITRVGMYTNSSLFHKIDSGLRCRGQ